MPLVDVAMWPVSFRGMLSIPPLELAIDKRYLWENGKLRGDSGNDKLCKHKNKITHVKQTYNKTMDIDPQGQGIMAVSYTHLDVYKRQCFTCNKEI